MVIRVISRIIEANQIELTSSLGQFEGSFEA